MLKCTSNLLLWQTNPGRPLVIVKQMAAPFDLERLYDDHAQALFAFLLSFTRNEADTRDLLQELFIKLARLLVCSGAFGTSGRFCCG